MPSFNSRTFIIPALIFFIYDFGITDIFSISANLFTVVTKGITTTESLDRPESLLGTITFGVYSERIILLVNGTTIQVLILLLLKSLF